MASAAAVYFLRMSEAEIRQWVETNPGRVNDQGRRGFTPLIMAAKKHSHSLVVLLLDEKGANVNSTTWLGTSALHFAASLEILNALVDRDADPILADNDGEQPLMLHARRSGPVDIVARLLRDPRVRATVNMQDERGNTALHWACWAFEDEEAALKVRLLLQAGTNPTITNKKGQVPLDVVRSRHPTHHAVITLFEQALAEPEKTWLVVKARRLVAAVTGNAVDPSCLQARVARGQLLPHVALASLTADENESEEEEGGGGPEGRKLRTTLAFLCGVGREGMPVGVFEDVFMPLLMFSWDPLRRKNGDTGTPAQQG